MKMNSIKQIVYADGPIFTATTLKNKAWPDEANQKVFYHKEIETGDARVMERNNLVRANRKALADQSLPLTDWILSDQIHQDHLALIESVKDLDKLEKEDGILIAKNADALYCSLPEKLIGIYTADCGGILLIDESKPALALIHSGWKGTVQAITLKSARELFKNGKLDPKNTKAFFCPCLLYDSFEVGGEVIEQIEEMARENDLEMDGCIRKGEREGKYYLDNQGINAIMLQKAGLSKENITLTEIDTGKDRENCFSYRKDNPFGEHFTYGFITSQEEPSK